MTEPSAPRRSQPFRRTFRGYDPAAVDAAIDVADHEIDGLRTELESARTDLRDTRLELSMARAEIEGWHVREGRIVELTLAAEREAHNIVERAERQAGELLERATHASDDVISKRRAELRTLQGRIEGLTKLRQDVRSSVSATIFGLERATLEMREGLTRIEQLHLETTTRQLAEAVRAGDEPSTDVAARELEASLGHAASERAQLAKPVAERIVADAHDVAIEVFPVDSFATLRAYVRPIEASIAVESVEVVSYTDDTAELLVHAFDDTELAAVLAHAPETTVEAVKGSEHAFTVNLHSGASLMADVYAKAKDETAPMAAVLTSEV